MEYRVELRDRDQTTLTIEADDLRIIGTEHQSFALVNTDGGTVAAFPADHVSFIIPADVSPTTAHKRPSAGFS